MKIIIENKLYIDEEIKSNNYKSKLTIDLVDNKCTFNYLRDYSSKEKENFSKKGMFYMTISKYNHILKLLEKIKSNGKYKILFDTDDLNDSLNYIYLSIDSENYKIDCEELDYELLIHLTNYNILDKCSVDEIEKMF